MLLIVLISVFSLNASAASIKNNDFTMPLPKNYTAINADNLDSHEDFLQKINYTKSGFKDYLSKNNIIIYAIDKSNGSEVIVKAVASDFSSNIGDMNLLDNDAVKKVAQKIAPDKSYSVTEINGSKFLKVQIDAEDKAGGFFGTQYVTVKNDLIYSVSITFPDALSHTQALQIENSITENIYIDDNGGFNWNNFENIIITVIITICIIVFLVVAGYVVYTFINDVRTKNSSNDVAPYVKIKRRKF